MELLKTLVERGVGDIQANLSASDGSDAGSSDLSRTSDVGFNLMRNTIKTDGDISASDVHDYLERAHELNDEVDTVAYGLQTSDGSIVKVYVNEKDAEGFETAMQDMLGLEDDIEEAINQLAQKFDIVDVVWPTDTVNTDGDVPTDDLGMADDMGASLMADVDGAALAKAALDKIKNATDSVDEQKGTDMIGAKFLKRIQEEEAAGDFDGVNDGLTIELDARQKAIFMRLRRPLDKRILNLFAMSGIPGRFLDVEGIDGAIKEAGLKLRASPTVIGAFSSFYQDLGAARGLTIKSDDVQEAVVVDPKMKGSIIQKMLEAVLVELGLPESLVVQGGPQQVNLALYATAQLIEEESSLEQSLRTLFMRMKPGHKVEEAKIAEDVDAGSDDFVQAVVELAVALGIPERNLQFQLATLRQAVYKRKQTLLNRANVQRRVEMLTDLIKQGTRQTNVPQGTNPATGTDQT